MDDKQLLLECLAEGIPALLAFSSLVLLPALCYGLDWTIKAVKKGVKSFR